MLVTEQLFANFKRIGYDFLMLKPLCSVMLKPAEDKGKDKFKASNKGRKRM